MKKKLLIPIAFVVLLQVMIVKDFNYGQSLNVNLESLDCFAGDNPESDYWILNHEVGKVSVVISTEPYWNSVSNTVSIKTNYAKVLCCVKSCSYNACNLATTDRRCPATNM